MIGFPKNHTDILNHIKNKNITYSSKKMSDLIHQQMDYYMAEGLPINKTEYWQHFPLQFTKQNYVFDESPIEKTILPKEAFLKNSHVISIQNGSLKNSPNIENVKCISWKDFIEDKISLDSNIQNKIYESLDKPRNSFCSLNNVLSLNGLILIVEKTLDQPIEIQYLNHFDHPEHAFHFRSFIFVKEGAHARIIETVYGNFSENNQTAFFNLQNDSWLEKQAQLNYFRMDRGTEKDIQMNQFFAHLDQEAHLNTFTLSMNSRLNYYSQEITHQKEASSDLRGINLLDQNKHTSHKVSAIHKDVRSSSNQLFQSLLFEKSKSVFNGIINIEKKAQQSEAKQLSKNLLFSPQAFAVTCPELEVEADDVVAEHGAAVSSLEDQKDLLFYLQSRGLSKQESYQLVLLGVIDGVLNHMSKDLFESCEALITKQLKKIQNDQKEL